MRDLLFAVPWYLPTILAIVGLTAWVSGNRRQNSRIRTGGLVIILLAIGWAVMSYLVDTPKEICQRDSRRLIQAVVDRDWKTLDDLAAPDMTFKFGGAQWQIQGKEKLIAMVKANVDSIGLKSASVTDSPASESGATITVTLKVFSSQDISLDRPIDSQWEFDWQETNGRWLLHEMWAISVTGVTPEQVRGGLKTQ